MTSSLAHSESFFPPNPPLSIVLPPPRSLSAPIQSPKKPPPSDQISDSDNDDRIEKQRLILEENKQWKENTPFLYDLIIIHVLQWPSPTVEWFPGTEKPVGQDYTVQKVILGTDTCGQAPDYLMLAQVKPRLQDTEIGIQSLDLDGNRSEYASSSGVASAKVQVIKLINHHGEVNRTRFMPQNPSTIATRSLSGDVYLFNSREHPSKPLDSAFSPDLRLRGLTSEGSGLSWSKFKEGHLLSGAYDSQICCATLLQLLIIRLLMLCGLLRIGEEQSPEEAAEGPPELLFIRGGHTSKIYDFSWNPCEDWIIASVAEDNIIQIWQMADHIYNDEDEDDLPEDNSPKGS
ncbi:Histone-binding protein MSI1 [Citrus sinensis]|nr:Histone-binding protein MSI1 [Citrus sinensis]